MSDDLSKAQVSTQEPSAIDVYTRPFREMERILERITDAFVALDREGRYLYVNHKAAEVCGRAAEAMIGKHIWTEFPDLIESPFYHAYHKALQERTPVEIEVGYPAYDGRWFENRIYPSEEGISIFIQEVTERRSSQERLRESERRLAEAESIAHLGNWEWNLQTGEVSWSQELRRMIGWSEEMPPPSYDTISRRVHPDDAFRVRREVARAVKKGGEIDCENRVFCPDGREIIMHHRGHLVRDAAGAPWRVIAIAQDVTEQRKIEAALRESQANLRAILEATPASIIISRFSDGTILYVNPFARQLFGVAPDADVSRHTCIEFYHNPADRAETVRLLSLCPYVPPREVLAKHVDGTLIWVEGSFQRLTYKGQDAMLATHHDITARKQAEAERERLLWEAQERADRDPLTNLLNHRAFQKRLEAEAARAQREKQTLAVIMLDLDNFKFFNDVYGHAVGDEVLRLVAQRLEQVCRAYDTVARFGGDEFALLLPGVGHTLVAEVEARLRAEMNGLAYRPDLQERDIPITVSVGAALFPNEGQDWQEALQRADARLLRSKTGGEAETEADRVRRYMRSSLEGYSMLDALVTAVDNKDRYTRRHSEDVREYSLLIARELEMDAAALETIGVAALLHDVGKIGVPDAILRKPGRLTEAEFEAVKQHTLMGAALVSTVAGLESTLDAVRHHHEHWDGSGYPSGLKGQECPLIARLMAVADAFSAMTTDRPYRKALDYAQALAILEAGAGKQWDPECVEVFLGVQQRQTYQALPGWHCPE